METLNERIRNLRKNLNLTQAELALKLKVTDKAVSKWETGESNPDIGLLPKLADIYGVSLDYLLTGKKQDSISLEDMDSEKRMHYLIREDDCSNFIKYEYCNISKATNMSRNFRKENIYYGQSQRFGKSELPILNISVWKEIIDANANSIFSSCLDSLMSQIKDNISIAVILIEILDDFIKKCIDLDRADVLKALGVKYFQIGTNEIKSIGRRISFYLPIVYTGKYEQESTFYISNETLEYFFKNALNSQQCFNYITEPEIKVKEYTGDRYKYAYTYTHLYNEIIMLAIKYNRYDIVKKYLLAFEEEVIHTKNIGDRPNHYNYVKGFILNNGFINARTIDVSSEVINNTIKLGKIEIAKELNTYNKSVLDTLKAVLKNNFKGIDSLYVVSENEIDRLAKLNNADLDDDKKLELEAVKNHLINPDVLRTSRNLKLVRNILDNNYYNYYEFAYDSLLTGNVKELFEFFVDNDFTNLAATLMEGKNSYPYVLKSVWDIFSSTRGYSYYEENKQLIDSQNKIGLEKEFQLCNNSTIYRKGNLNGLIAYNEIFKKQYGDVDNYKDKFIDNPIIKRIKELKEEIYNDVAKIVAEEAKALEDRIAKEKITKTLTRDYFDNLIAKGEIELFIIKLCALQDAIFMYDYHYDGENYSERLESHIDDLNEKAPKSRKCDDGWGYDVLDGEWEEKEVIPAHERIEHLRELFYRLRISRNNIAHSTKDDVKELSIEELNECLEYVFSINVKEENI